MGDLAMRRQILSLLLVVSTVFISDIKISLAQSVNIFGNASPNETIYSGITTTFAVKFWSSKPGTISGILFYRVVKSPQGYIGSRRPDARPSKSSPTAISFVRFRPCCPYLSGETCSNVFHLHNTYLNNDTFWT
jgi:hypothetical protein